MIVEKIHTKLNVEETKMSFAEKVAVLKGKTPHRNDDRIDASISSNNTTNIQFLIQSTLTLKSSIVYFLNLPSRQRGIP